jgi:hypothetical protein
MPVIKHPQDISSAELLGALCVPRRLCMRRSEGCRGGAPGGFR